MKCKHFAEYEGICTNGDCFYRADLCPVEEHQETCIHYEQKQISDKELLQECKKHGIDIDDLINDFKKLVKDCFFNQFGNELTLEEVKKTEHYTYFLEKALTLKILKDYKRLKQENDEPCDSEAKRIIKCVEEGKLPPIFDEESYR